MSWLVARASHTHILFHDDNVTVYHHLEEATHSTFYAASIKPYQHAKNGRDAWFVLVGQYAGIDKWEAEIKKQEQLLHTHVCGRGSPTSLWKVSYLNIAMLMCACRPALNMLSINF